MVLGHCQSFHVLSTAVLKPPRLHGEASVCRCIQYAGSLSGMIAIVITVAKCALTCMKDRLCKPIAGFTPALIGISLRARNQSH